MSIGGGDGYGERDRTGEDSPSYGHGTARFTTRTRLPEGEGASRPTGGARGPGRSVVTIVGVVVLLIAAIAFANRGGGGDDGDSSPKADEAQPTAPSGDKPVQAQEGKIPSGFPHTREGAQSAAANYSVSLVSADIIKPGVRDGIVQQIFAASQVEQMKSKMDKAYSSTFLTKLGLDKNGEAKSGTYVSRTAPVGTKVVKYSDSSAKLEVWCTGVYGTAGEGSRNPVASDWFTMQLDLRWTDGDWKVQHFAQKEGPAPVDGDNKASGADEIAGAVKQYGGFTYAR